MRVPLGDVDDMEQPPPTRKAIRWKDAEGMFDSQLGGPDSWLWEKGNSTVRIVRTGTMDFEVLGPGERCAHYTFADQKQIVSFLNTTAEELTAAGYRPRGYGFERRAVEQPPRGSNRRRSPSA